MRVCLAAALTQSTRNLPYSCPLTAHCCLLATAPCVSSSHTLSPHPHPSASHNLQPARPPLVGQADPRTLDRRIYPPSPSCTWQICSRLCISPHFPTTHSAPSRKPRLPLRDPDNVCDTQDHLRRHQAGAILPGLPEDHLQFSGPVRERWLRWLALPQKHCQLHGPGRLSRLRQHKRKQFGLRRDV